MATCYYPRFQAVRINADNERVPVTSATITAYNVTAASALASISSDSAGDVAEGSFTATVGDIVRFGHGTYPEVAYFKLTATQAEAYVEPSNPAAYVMENLGDTAAAKSVLIYGQDTDNPDSAPVLLGSGLVGTTAEIPMQVNVAKNLRLYPVTVSEKNAISHPIDLDNYEDIAITTTDTLARLADDAWESVRRNSADSAFEAYDTRAARPLFAHFVDRKTTSASQQTLHLYNVNRSLWLVNGDTVKFEYTIQTAATTDIKAHAVYFAGTMIYNTPDDIVDNNKTIRIKGEITRKNATTVRCSTQLLSINWNPFPIYTEVTSLDLEGTSYDLALKVTDDVAGGSTLKTARAEVVNAPSAAIVTTSMWDYWEADSYSQSDGTNITTNWTGKFASKVMTVSGTPTYEDSELNANLPIIRLGADSNDYFTLPIMAALTAGHIFIVIKVTDVSTNAGHKLGSYASNDNYYPYTPDTPDGIYESFGSTDRKTCGGSVATITDWHVVEMYSATNDWSLYQNGQLIHNDTTHTVGFNSAPTIGTNGAAYMKADLWGVYIYSAKLSDANREKMYRYIAQVTGV